MIMSMGFTPEIQSYVLASEGGYVNHPKDPGKATNMGITIGTLRAWRGSRVTNEDVKNLSKEEAMSIYKRQYWDNMQCSSLPLGLDYLVLDYGINSGPARSIKDLQRTVGATADGVMGSFTLEAVLTFIRQAGIDQLLLAFATRRWNFVRGLSTFSTFGVGWKRRIWGAEEGMQSTDTGAADRAMKLSQERYDANSTPEVSVGSAFPEKPGVGDMLKDPAVISGGAGALATILGAVQDQPVLQVAAVLGVATVVFLYIKSKRAEDPS